LIVVVQKLKSPVKVIGEVRVDEEGINLSQRRKTLTKASKQGARLPSNGGEVEKGRTHVGLVKAKDVILRKAVASAPQVPVVNIEEEEEIIEMPQLEKKVDFLSPSPGNYQEQDDICEGGMSPAPPTLCMETSVEVEEESDSSDSNSSDSSDSDSDDDESSSSSSSSEASDVEGKVKTKNLNFSMDCVKRHEATNKNGDEKERMDEDGDKLELVEIAEKVEQHQLMDRSESANQRTREELELTNRNEEDILEGTNENEDILELTNESKDKHVGGANKSDDKLEASNNSNSCNLELSNKSDDKLEQQTNSNEDTREPAANECVARDEKKRDNVESSDDGFSNDDDDDLMAGEAGGERHLKVVDTINDNSSSNDDYAMSATGQSLLLNNCSIVEDSCEGEEEEGNDLTGGPPMTDFEAEIRRIASGPITAPGHDLDGGHDPTDRLSQLEALSSVGVAKTILGTETPRGVETAIQSGWGEVADGIASKKSSDGCTSDEDEIDMFKESGGGKKDEDTTERMKPDVECGGPSLSTSNDHQTSTSTSTVGGQVQSMPVRLHYRLLCPPTSSSSSSSLSSDVVKPLMSTSLLDILKPLTGSDSTNMGSGGGDGLVRSRLTPVLSDMSEATEGILAAGENARAKRSDIVSNLGLVPGGSVVTGNEGRRGEVGEGRNHGDGVGRVVGAEDDSEQGSTRRDVIHQDGVHQDGDRLVDKESHDISALNRTCEDNLRQETVLQESVGRDIEARQDFIQQDVMSSESGAVYNSSRQDSARQSHATALDRASHGSGRQEGGTRQGLSTDMMSLTHMEMTNYPDASRSSLSGQAEYTEHTTVLRQHDSSTTTTSFIAAVTTNKPSSTSTALLHNNNQLQYETLNNVRSSSLSRLNKDCRSVPAASNDSPGGGSGGSSSGHVKDSPVGSCGSCVDVLSPAGSSCMMLSPPPPPTTQPVHRSVTNPRLSAPSPTYSIFSAPSPASPCTPFSDPSPAMRVVSVPYDVAVQSPAGAHYRHLNQHIQPAATHHQPVVSPQGQAGGSTQQFRHQTQQAQGPSLTSMQSQQHLTNKSLHAQSLATNPGNRSRMFSDDQDFTQPRARMASSGPDPVQPRTQDLRAPQFPSSGDMVVARAERRTADTARGNLHVEKGIGRGTSHGEKNIGNRPSSVQPTNQAYHQMAPPSRTPSTLSTPSMTLLGHDFGQTQSFVNLGPSGASAGPVFHQMQPIMNPDGSGAPVFSHHQYNFLYGGGGGGGDALSVSEFNYSEMLRSMQQNYQRSASSSGQLVHNVSGRASANHLLVSGQLGRESSNRTPMNQSATSVQLARESANRTPMIQTLVAAGDMGREVANRTPLNHGMITGQLVREVANRTPLNHGMMTAQLGREVANRTPLNHMMITGQLGRESANRTPMIQSMVAGQPSRESTNRTPMIQSMNTGVQLSREAENRTPMNQSMIIAGHLGRESVNRNVVLAGGQQGREAANRTPMSHMMMLGQQGREASNRTPMNQSFIVGPQQHDMSNMNNNHSSFSHEPCPSPIPMHHSNQQSLSMMNHLCPSPGIVYHQRTCPSPSSVYQSQGGGGEGQPGGSQQLQHQPTTMAASGSSIGRLQRLTNRYHAEPQYAPPPTSMSPPSSVGMLLSSGSTSARSTSQVVGQTGGGGGAEAGYITGATGSTRAYGHGRRGSQKQSHSSSSSGSHQQGGGGGGGGAGGETAR